MTFSRGIAPNAARSRSAQRVTTDLTRNWNGVAARFHGTYAEHFAARRQRKRRPCPAWGLWATQSRTATAATPLLNMVRVHRSLTSCRLRSVGALLQPTSPSQSPSPLPRHMTGHAHVDGRTGLGLLLCSDRKVGPEGTEVYRLWVQRAVFRRGAASPWVLMQ